MKLNSDWFSSTAIRITRREEGVGGPILEGFNEERGVASRGNSGVVSLLPGRLNIGELQWRNDQSTFFSFSGSSSTGFANRSMTPDKLSRKPEEAAIRGEGRCFSASLLKKRVCMIHLRVRSLLWGPPLRRIVIKSAPYSGQTHKRIRDSLVSGRKRFEFGVLLSKHHTEGAEEVSPRLDSTSFRVWRLMSLKRSMTYSSHRLMKTSAGRIPIRPYLGVPGIRGNSENSSEKSLVLNRSACAISAALVIDDEDEEDLLLPPSR
jgi:hypothetical protein